MGDSTAKTAADSDGIALLLAAMRDDRDAVANLTASLTHRQAQDAAIYCAYFAVMQMRELEKSAPGRNFEAILQAAALKAAIRSTQT